MLLFCQQGADCRASADYWLLERFGVVRSQFWRSDLGRFAVSIYPKKDNERGDSKSRRRGRWRQTRVVTSAVGRTRSMVKYRRQSASGWLGRRRRRCGFVSDDGLANPGLDFESAGAGGRRWTLRLGWRQRGMRRRQAPTLLRPTLHAQVALNNAGYGTPAKGRICWVRVFRVWGFFRSNGRNTPWLWSLARTIIRPWTTSYPASWGW